jgi:prophage tail gpP-like protein
VNDINIVKLLVDGKAYGGWERVEIKRSLECMAGAFVLQVTEKWDGQAEPYALREGLACEVYIGDDLVITGYIDDYLPKGDKESRTINIHGRDKTADLVDCSAIHKAGQWHNVPLLQIVEDIARPFGITVVEDDEADLGENFKSFALQEGEKAFDAIDRACRMRAVLCTSTAKGEVLLTQASDESTGVQLIEGLNILEYEAKHTWRERYSVVTMKGQGKGDDDESGATVAHAKAEVKDAEINRYRPLVVVAEHGSGLKSLKDRAAWEVQVRMGRGKRGEVTVNGWRTGRDGLTGQLWQPNRMVFIDSPSMFLSADMLIASCTYSITEKGSLTQLEFARREAFEVVGGVKRSKLSNKLNHRSQREKKKKGDGYQASWELEPPTKAGK